MFQGVGCRELKWYHRRDILIIKNRVLDKHAAVVRAENNVTESRPRNLSAASTSALLRPITICNDYQTGACKAKSSPHIVNVEEQSHFCAYCFRGGYRNGHAENVCRQKQKQARRNDRKGAAAKLQSNQ